MSCSIPMVATIDLRQTTSARFTGSGLVLSTRGQGSTGRSTFPRGARMLATLMGVQSDLRPLGFGKMGGRSRKEYFAAVQAGMGGDYRPMEKIFTAVIRRTHRRQA